MIFIFFLSLNGFEVGLFRKLPYLRKRDPVSREVMVGRKI
jgi:hypothetical protein